MHLSRPVTTSQPRAYRVLMAVTTLRRSPASTVLAIAVMIASGLVWLFRVPSFDLLAVSPTHSERPWSVVTHLIWSISPWAATGYALMLLTVGAAVERRLGTRRFLVTGLIAAAVGALALMMIYPVINLVDPRWGHALADARMGGPLSLVVGALAAYSALLDVLWRQRVRTGLLALLLALAGFGGGADDIALLGAGVAGLLLGCVRWQHEAPDRSLIGIRQEARALVPLTLVAVAVGTLLSAWAAHPVGPLSAARFTVGPQLLDAQTVAALCADPFATTECARVMYLSRLHSTGPVLLGSLPLILQLILAEGLRRGRRGAAIGTVALQLLTAVLATIHLVLVMTMARAGAQASPLGLATHGFPSARLLVPILAPLALAALVLAARRHFQVRCRPGTFRVFWLHLGLVVAGSLVLGTVLGWLIRDQFSPQATAGTLLVDLAERLLPSAALAVISPSLFPSSALAGGVVQGLPVLVWAVACVLLWRALRDRPLLHSTNRDDLKAVVRSSGAGSMGWMNTWPGNQGWVSPDGHAAMAYRANAGVALTITQPAARTTHLREAVVGFADYATAHSLIPALYSVHQEVADIASSLGWTVLQVAEEAVIDLDGLAFTGKRFQDIRTAMNHATREGIRAVWTTYRTCSPGVCDQINAISTAWAADKSLPEMGFTLGGIPETDDEETRLLLAVDPEGTVHAVTSWLPVYENGALVGLTLDVMRRRDGGFRPAIEYLIASAALAAREQGMRFVSLSGAPLARSGQVSRPDDSATGLDPVLDSLGRALEPVYGFRSLLAFKTKFGPRFTPLYLAIPDIATLPSVAVAISTAYLPNLSPMEYARITSKLVSHD